MSQPKLVVFAGSLRTGSYNKKLAAIAADGARAAGAEVTLVDLRELNLPLFDQDIEDSTGLPPGAKKFKALLRESDGFLIATQIQPLDLFTNRVELKRVLFLPRTLESVAPAIVFGKPAFLTWQSIQMVDQGLVMIARKWSKQVTISEHFGPDGNIIRNDAIARVCKRLRNARRTREAIENSLRIYFLSELENVRQESQF